jgi:hypothetical protein
MALTLNKKTLEKGEYLQGSNAFSSRNDRAPLREEKREVSDHLQAQIDWNEKSFKHFLILVF